MDEATILLTSGIISAIGIVICAIEDITHFDAYDKSGILSWQVTRLRYRLTSEGLVAVALDWIYAPKRYRFVLISLALASSAMFLTPLFPNILPVVSLLVLAGLAAVGMRSLYGTDGSDQMNLIVFAALFISTISPPDSLAHTACVWFIALQACLSYLLAGYFKLVSPVWRSGGALVAIMSTELYGHRQLYGLLSRHQLLSFASCWLVILIECLFPLALAGNAGVTAFFLAMGFTFHISCALLMGLNGFFWSFIATYPCVWYCSSRFTFSWALTSFEGSTVRVAMNIFDVAVLTLFSIWIVLTIVKHVRASLIPRRIVRHVSSGPFSWIYPRWSFFAPYPGVHDYRLLYRDKFSSGNLGAWHEVPLIERSAWWCTLWNPGKTQNKAILDLVAELAVEVQILKRGDDRLLSLSMPYLVALSYITCIPRVADAVSTQFLLVRRSRDSQDEVYYASPFHALRHDSSDLLSETKAVEGRLESPLQIV